MPHDSGQRLQKALAHLGLGSRREVEDWIRAGRLTVNGAIASLGMRVRDADRIRLDGRLVRQRPAASQQVFVCHRSPGEPLDASTPQRPRSTPPEAPEPAPREALFERLPRSGGRRFIAVSPMPLPDGGLELATSDGEIAERLQRAVRGLTAEYRVRLRGALDESQLASVRSGTLDSGERLEVLDCSPRGGEGTNHWYALTARGASGRDVRQLLERSGAIVGRVLRTRLGPVVLDRSLSRGRFRKLSPAQVDALLGRRETGPSTGEGRPRARPPAGAPRRRARATARRSSGR